MQISIHQRKLMELDTWYHLVLHRNVMGTRQKSGKAKMLAN